VQPTYRENLIALLERIAGGIEKMAEDPVVEMEVGPPICPHCGRFNPSVTTDEQGGTGTIFEIYLEMVCNSCGNTIYGTPVQWSMHNDVAALRAELVERMDSVDNGRRAARDNL
jgi:hypothetical protein